MNVGYSNGCHRTIHRINEGQMPIRNPPFGNTQAIGHAIISFHRKELKLLRKRGDFKLADGNE